MLGLHVHLKHGIDLDCLDVAPHDSYEDLADEHYDPLQRAAKRRRIEMIATQYLRGRPPLILSAALRGPFDKGWSNPWAKKSKKEEPPPGRTAGPDQAICERATIRGAAKSQPTGDRVRKLHPPPSPETSRAVVILSQSEPVDDHQDHGVAPLSDSPLQQDESGGTEFFSPDAEPPVTIDTSESNRFWLRRQPLERVHFAQPHTENDDPSPTRSRTGSRRVNENGQVQLAPPRMSLTRARSSPARTNTTKPEWQSSASASMVISSSARPSPGPPAQIRGSLSSPALPTLMHQGSGSDTIASLSVPQAEPLPTSAVTDTHLQGAAEQTTESTSFAPLNAQDTGLQPVGTRPTRTTRSSKFGTAAPPRTFTPINAAARMAGPGSAHVVHFKDAHPFVAEGHRGATNLALQAVEKALSSQFSRAEIHQSAERCAQPAPVSTSKGTSGKTKRAPSSKERNTGLDRVTSPTPLSSTGLAYRKVGEVQPKKVAQKSKPRPVTFSSSPVAAVGPDLLPEALPPALSPAEESRTARRDVYQVPQSPASGEMEQQQSPGTSRNSGYSTQAAMMLAQLEFQDGTMPSLAAETPGPWLHPQHQTPQSYVEDPSLAFTPFSEFNAELDKRRPPEKLSQDLPISTQELLLAASPFAFSTVKKKPMRPLGSTLRFTVFPSGEQAEHNEQINGARSPTPSERVPLKARNSQVSFQNTASEKGSQETSLLEPKSKPNVVELPQLDFRTSLDDLGPNGDLEFTDRFLRNLKGMT